MPKLTAKINQHWQPNQQVHQQFQQQFPQQPPTPTKADWEIALEKVTSHNFEFQEESRNYQINTTTSINNLEVQVGQISQQFSMQAQGTLPSTTIKNLRNNESINNVDTIAQKENISKREFIFPYLQRLKREVIQK